MAPKGTLQSRCELCGRTGMGGYILDGGPPYPICSEGDYSCLWYQFCEQNLRCDALEVRAVALHQVLQGYSLPQVLLRHVLAFLYDEDGVFPDLPFTMIFFPRGRPHPRFNSLPHHGIREQAEIVHFAADHTTTEYKWSTRPITRRWQKKQAQWQECRT